MFNYITVEEKTTVGYHFMFAHLEILKTENIKYNQGCGSQNIYTLQVEAYDSIATVETIWQYLELKMCLFYVQQSNCCPRYIAQRNSCIYEPGNMHQSTLRSSVYNNKN